MTTDMRPAYRKTYLAVAAAFLAVATSGAHSMDAPATIGAEQLVELDEVRVQGKKLARRVADAEDRLYKAYNKVNKDDDYDIHCGQMSLEPGSLIMVRTCVPGFLADYYERRRISSSYFPSYTYDSYIGGFANPYYSGYDSVGSASSSVFGSSMMPVQVSRLPVQVAVERRGLSPASEFDDVPASAVTAYRRQAYADTILSVITSDEHLTELGTELVGLYQEMELAQNRFAQLRSAAGLDTEPHRTRGRFPRSL